jgi:hypothetical protein
MRLVYWEYKGVKVPMAEDAEEGKLYCTSKVICKGLGLKEKDLYNMCLNHPQHFQDSLKYSNLAVKDFISEHRGEFGVQRVRKIYTDAELIAFAILSKSPVSIEFMQDYIKFVRSRVSVGFVSQEAHDALQAKFDDQQRRLELVEKFIEDIASDDGKRLNRHKEIRHLKVVRGAI